ncbi:MAG: hypothetical protein II695_07875 [Oscillospiraceae bacterium]|nr:hypothetical protein [Oscillospiraceae bacterium]
MTEKLRKLCDEALRGKIKTDSFYSQLDEMSQSEECSDDLACVIEDAMMELDMNGGESRTALKESARMILEELQNI